MRNISILLLGAASLAGCTTPIMGDPAAEVMAVAETEPVGTANQDAADDPAIWRNPDDPSQSLIVATDKRQGLYVYGLDGKSRSLTQAGEVNNVDLVDMGETGIIVVASDRNDLANAKFRIYRLDPTSAELALLGIADAGAGEAYGICLTVRNDALIAYSAPKEGIIREFRIELDANDAPALTPLRTMTVPSQPEGCVADPRDGTLYIGEEAGGIWRFPLGETTGEIVAPVDNKLIVADLEGLAIAPEGTDGGYLVASSQGDNAYAVFTLPGMTPVGRFRIAAGTLGSTEETDGIELVNQSFGSDYPDGLFIAQDGVNGAQPQNFKLVSWRDILAALGK